MHEDHLWEVDTALLGYWTSRDAAAAAQLASGRVDTGMRGTATSGGHLNQVASMFARVCLAAGAPERSIFFKAPPSDPLYRQNIASGYTLPGFFRPTKQWDLVVHGRHAEPVAAVELKSQNGPSFGNNANNRVEEALGNALDIRHAHEIGLLPNLPWTGFVYVIEDAPGSRRPATGREATWLLIDPEFGRWSYQDRVRLLCERIVQERLYDAAWAVATSRPSSPEGFTWTELDEVVSGYEVFADSLATAVRAHWDPRALNR